MRFGVIPPVGAGIGADPAWMMAFARHAEACGFESIVLVEHAVVVSDYRSTYPYASSGRMPLPDDCPIPDPLDVLAYLAAGTERLGLATGVLVVPNHHPVVLAKRLATIDTLSGGRVRLCVGVGWMREEVEASGADFATRGRRTDETIDAMRALWAAGTDDGGATFHGEFFDFDHAQSYPKPVQPGGIPIHVGGHSAAAARRAGRRGDGLQPLGVDPSKLAELVAIMRDEAERAGRDPARLELSLGGGVASTTPERVGAAADAGAVRMVVSPSKSDDLQLVCDELSALAERVDMT